MRKWTLPLAAAGIAALSFGALHAQQGGAPQLPGQMDASRVTAGTYKSDPAHSLIGWRLNHFGFNDYFGIFGDVDATLTIDPANLAGAKVEATIPINPTVASAGLRDHLLRAPAEGKTEPDFFGPNPEPARFVSTNVAVDGQEATITGDLTLNGVTKPVTLEAEFTGAGKGMMNQKETIGFEGETTIKRSDFGLDTFVPMVSDEVELEITMAFEKQ